MFTFSLKKFFDKYTFSCSYRLVYYFCKHRVCQLVYYFFCFLNNTLFLHIKIMIVWIIYLYKIADIMTVNRGTCFSMPLVFAIKICPLDAVVNNKFTTICRKFRPKSRNSGDRTILHFPDAVQCNFLRSLSAENRTIRLSILTLYLCM